MAHEMVLGVDSMFSAIEKPWHYDEHPLQCAITDEVLTSEQALKISGLDYKVDSCPVIVNDDVVEGYRANVVDGDVLGIVSDRYKIVQNNEAFAFVDAILQDGDAQIKFETAGSLFNRRRVWMLAKMPSSKILGDDIENYLFFTNGHDGKSAIQVGLTNVRIVCNNTLQAAIAGCPRVWSTKHMGDMESKTKEAIRTLGLANNYIQALSEKAEEYQQKQITKEALYEFVDMLFPLDDDASALQENRVFAFRNNFIDLYNEKPDIENFRGTAWGTYLALTDYVSHVQPVRMTKTFKETRWASFMDGNKMLEAGQKILDKMIA